MKKDIKSLIFKYRAVFVLIILCLVLSIMTPRFIGISNIMNVLTQISVNAIIAIGMTCVILTGGIDLSVGSVVAIAGAVTASLVKSNVSILIALLVALAIGSLIGLFNGAVISKMKIQPFIVTLSTMSILRGVTYVYTNGIPISGLSSGFMFIGNYRFLEVPFPVFIVILIFLITWYVINQTRFGRYVYALGGNEDSARLTGINTDSVKTIVYILSGVFAAISGVIVTSRIGSASPNAGSGYEMDAIAAVVLGGTSMAGGEGTIIGSIIGAMIIGVLNNGLNLLNVSPFYQSIVKGVVILLAVMMDKKNK